MGFPRDTKTPLRILIITAIVIVGLATRMRAVALLPIDFDEDDYLRAAQLYASIIRKGSWHELPNVSFTSEHPALAKLLYGLILATLPPADEIPEHSPADPAAESLPQPHLNLARATSAALGSLEVLLLALLDPLAAFFLATHTFTIKYTSHVMLEALPSVTSAIAVIAYKRSGSYTGKGWSSWLAVSAIAVGLTASGKYAYCVAPAAILIHWLCISRVTNRRYSMPDLGLCYQVVLWCMLAAAVFWATNPFLWHSTLPPLFQSVRYHVDFSHGDLVKLMNFPFFMPIIWLFEWPPWHPTVFPFGPDPLIALSAILGLRSLWKRDSVYVVWIVTALVFLFIWPTKWPQYVLILTFPWSLAAAEGFRTVLLPRIQHHLHLRTHRSADTDEPNEDTPPNTRVKPTGPSHSASLRARSSG